MVAYFALYHLHRRQERLVLDGFYFVVGVVIFVDDKLSQFGQLLLCVASPEFGLFLLRFILLNNQFLLPHQLLCRQIIQLVVFKEIARIAPTQWSACALDAQQ